MKPQRTLATLTFALISSATVMATPVLSDLQLGAQAPASVLPGESASYALIVSKAGVGSLNGYLSISGLPEGVTGTFVPPVAQFTPGSRPSLNATLTLETAGLTPAGTHPFTIMARHGNSGKSLTTSGTLIVGNSPRVQVRPTLLIERMNGETRLICLASPGQVCSIEATTDLASGSWTTIATKTLDAAGFFEVIEADVPNFPIRFYRAVSS